MFKFFILALTLLSLEVKSAEELRELEMGRRFLARKLSTETIQKADEIRLEGLRVIKKLQSFNVLEKLPDLGFLGLRLQYRLDNDPTLARIINIFERPIQFSDDLISIINITKVTSNTGVIIGGASQTDYDLILSYVREAITELFPVGAQRIFEENLEEDASTLVQFLDIQITRLQSSLRKKSSKKKAAKAAFAAAERKIEADRLLHTEGTKEAGPESEEESYITVGIQKTLIAAELAAAKESSGITAEIRTQEGYPLEDLPYEEATASVSESTSGSAASTAEKSTMLYNQLIRNTQSSFFQSWISRQDIKKIDDLFDLGTAPVDSLTVSNLLKNLVKKQRDTAYKAEFREGNGSHKLAVLVSETGKKVLFPFAHHPGENLDRHSRDMVIDGFKELFGIST